MPCNAKAMTVWQGIARVLVGLAARHKAVCEADCSQEALKSYLAGDLKLDGDGYGRLHLILLGDQAMTSAGQEEKFSQLISEVHSLLRQVEAKLTAISEVVLLVPKHATTLGSNADEPRFLDSNAFSSIQYLYYIYELTSISLCLWK